MKRLIGLALYTLSLPIALACLWDVDTLEEEAIDQKEVADIVMGKIMKHTNYFYEQKVEYTKPMLEQEKVKAVRYDDLAVAYDRLGKYDDAIAIIEQKEAKFPGLYETYANWGTFYAHKGDYVKALELLNKAIKINPKAHFGREKYQIQLIEYLQALEKDPELIKKQDFLGILKDGKPVGSFPLRKDATKKSRQAALKKLGLPSDVKEALAGIIVFGNGNKSKHVWFSLGLVLANQGDRNLAQFALYQAQSLGHPLAKQIAWEAQPYVELMAPNHEEFDQFTLNQPAKTELVEWVEKKQKEEDQLIKDGKLKKAFGY